MTRTKDEGADATRAAGRGGLAIAGAKVSFIVFGFVQQLLLPRILGTDGYGDVSLVLAIVGIVNNVVVGTSIQGVSRVVSGASPDRAPYVFRKALETHFVLAALAASIFGAAAGSIARFENAPHLAGPMRLVALVVLLYGLYAPLVGGLNGARRFGDQAALDVVYQALRTVGLAGGALVFVRAGMNGVSGALAGFVAAAAIILPAAALRAKLGRRGDAGLGARAYLGELAPVFLGQAFLSALMQTDFLALAHFLGAAAQREGLGPEAAATFVGVQRGVQLFGFLPYQLLMSITFVLFPLLARAHAAGDRDEMRATTSGGVRLALLVTGLMSAPIAGLAPHVLRFAYGAKPEIYTSGGEPLRVYAIGMGAFSVLGIVTSALVSLGRARIAAALNATAIALVAASSFVLVRGAPFGEAMLVRSALATTSAMFAVTIAGAILLHRTAGAFAPVASIVRVALAVAAAVLVGGRLPYLGKLVVPLEAAAVAGVYVALLLATRELGRADLERLKRIVARR